MTTQEPLFHMGDRVRWSRQWMRAHLMDMSLRASREIMMGVAVGSRLENGTEIVRVKWGRCRIKTEDVPAIQLERWAKTDTPSPVFELDWVSAEMAVRYADDNLLYQLERGGQFELSITDGSMEAWLEGAVCWRPGQPYEKPDVYLHGEHWLALYPLYKEPSVLPDRVICYYVGLALHMKPQDEEGE
jgi:hypothetical protein